MSEMAPSTDSGSQLWTCVHATGFHRHNATAGPGEKPPASQRMSCLRKTRRPLLVWHAEGTIEAAGEDKQGIEASESPVNSIEIDGEPIDFRS